MEALS
ncbi:hypothetical protein S40285_09394, partial [Stachybotrys chlorohalonatus IBT 40285]|jgi:hypothetical protein